MLSHERSSAMVNEITPVFYDNEEIIGTIDQIKELDFDPFDNIRCVGSTILGVRIAPMSQETKEKLMIIRKDIFREYLRKR
jgi:hypothetical protein